MSTTICERRVWGGVGIDVCSVYMVNMRGRTRGGGGHPGHVCSYPPFSSTSATKSRLLELRFASFTNLYIPLENTKMVIENDFLIVLFSHRVDFITGDPWERTTTHNTYSLSHNIACICRILGDPHRIYVWYICVVTRSPESQQKVYSWTVGYARTVGEWSSQSWLSVVVHPGLYRF